MEPSHLPSGPQSRNPVPEPHPHSVIFVSCAAVLLAAVSTGVAAGLVRLIGLVTNLAFFGRLSTELTSPADNQLGGWVVLVPALGGVIIGLMARYGSKAIRGHGIPEAMEQILQNRSRIAPSVTVLKPVSAAISIGTGGPFRWLGNSSARPPTNAKRSWPQAPRPG
jgi:chloride channel protein, CIC family